MRRTNAWFVIDARSPDGKTVSITALTAEELPAARVDADNRVTNYTYNADHQLTQTTHPADATLDVTNSYDRLGRQSAVTDQTGSRAFTYDPAGVLLAVATTYTGVPALTVAYSYYPDGSRATLTTPAGTHTYHYDAAGRMVGLQQPTGKLSTWQYAGNDWLTTHTLGNGAATSYARNALGQLTGLTNTAPNLSPISTFDALLYDAQGNRTSLAATLTGLPALSGVTTNSYDLRGQLTGEQSTRAGGYSSAFVYDATGNPTSFRGQTHGYNSLNQLTDARFAYDATGNPTTYKGVALSFDANNQLLAYGAQLTAGYRGDGLRAWKEASSTGRTYFLYDGTQPVVEFHYDGSVVTPTAATTFGPTGLLTRTNLQTNAEVWYQFDPDGNVAQRLDAQGNVLSSDVYDAYGNLLAGGDASDPYGYKGQAGYYTDHETGLVLCTFRYYDPSLGRWLTRDPIGTAGGVNLYGYCGGNPVRRIDTSGYCPNLQELGNFAPHGIAVILSGSIEAGAGPQIIGGGAQGSAGLGAFYGKNGPDVGVFGGGGACIYALGRGVSAVKGNLQNNGVVGAYIGPGAGGMLTNAQKVKDLEGPFETASLNMGAGIGYSVNILWGKNDDCQTIWTISVTGKAPSYGFDVSYYPTTTRTWSVWNWGKSLFHKN